MSTNKRGRLRPTHEWDLLVPLFEWPEQKRYEEIRPLVLFDVSVAERAEEVGLSQSTLYRKLGGFEAEGMESLFASQTARKRKLPPTVRRFIVDLKAEHPPFNLNERQQRAIAKASPWTWPPAPTPRLPSLAVRDLPWRSETASSQAPKGLGPVR
jgi:hypothetical protein